MTKSELSRLIKYGESQTVSLKALRTKPSTLARPMVSFSNTNDGVLIVGVDDKTRKIHGAKTTKEREEGLDNIHKAARQCCQPNVDILKIEEMETPDGMVFLVSIAKDPDEVYVTEGGVLVRKGTMEYREWVDTTVTVLHPAEVGVQKEERISFEGLNERQKKAVNFVIEKGRIGRREYVEINNISERTAARDLKDLLEKGVLITNNKRGWALRYLLRQ